MMLGSLGGFACSRGAQAAEDLPEPKDQRVAPEAATSAEAVLAAGCFWCVEAVFERLEGVSNVVSGYAGGSAQTATYEQVAAGETRHAEAVKITYDPSQISYGQLLRVFFATHDPTQVNRQGPDVGPQYRTAIFYASEREQQVAAAYIQQLEAAGVFSEPIATTLEPLEAFYPAETYHQDFVEQNPRHGYVRQWALPKLEKLQKQFGDLLKTP
jgi:peptide-methionine (S)-S-oxide reductase